MQPSLGLHDVPGQSHPAPIPPSSLEQPSASAEGEEGVFFPLRALMITQVKWTERDCEDNRGHYSGQHNQDNNCDCDNQQMLKVREIQRCDPEDVTQTVCSAFMPPSLRSH